MERQAARLGEADFRRTAGMATVGRDASGETARITRQTGNVAGEAGRSAGAVGSSTAGEPGEWRGSAAPVLTWRLDRGELAGIADVRRGLRELLRGCGADPERSHVAEVLISELVTNALVHTDGGAVVRARLLTGASAARGERLRFEVRDFTRRAPQPRKEATHAGTSGRGLLLVDAMADAWGVREHGVGKAVWCELGTTGSED
ncbi:ATP-binding protein [Streptomyces sp. 796.1]|uniref:ATP-binding protein n=1 Tax=Streptomyces sp. 796.1 TaxID=3163029 RepID=UPI0039C9F9AE